MRPLTGTDRSRLTRRRLLAVAGAGVAAAAVPVSLRGSGQRAIAAKPIRFRSRLPIPRVIDAADFELPMVEAEIPILPGRPTRMWTYDGEFPGPTIRRPTGTPTRVTFTHRLPREAGELTVHLHGGHNRSADDGQPGGLTDTLRRSLYCDISPNLSARESGNELLIPRGGSRTYTYDFTEAGSPSRGTMHWYHDHRLEATARNIWRGLSGMWIVDDPSEADLSLPSGPHDLPLLITDRSFNSRNQLTDPFGAGAHAPNDGTTGRQILVNGALLPYHRVEGRRYRLRILNASNFRSYDLELSGGAEMIQVGTESGLLPAPLTRRRILLGPAERVDLVVDFGRAANRDVELRSIARRDGPDRLGSKSYRGPLMQFRVGKRVTGDPAVPAQLRPLPGWVNDASPTPQKTWRITIGSGIAPSWLINGRTFDPAFVEHRPRLGTVETWKLVNDTRVAHLVHIHHTDWFMLTRNGKQPAPWERCLKETFFLDPGDEVVVAGRFSDYAGRYVVHCHMTDHEDHGLMSQFETVA